jgi:hypothetical protein
MDSKLEKLREEINATKKQKKIPFWTIYIVLGVFLVFLVYTALWFSSNQNQIKLTVTNGSELVKRLELRTEDAEKARLLERDSVNNLNKLINKTAKDKETVEFKNKEQAKTIKRLNAKVDSLLRITTGFKRSDLEPVKRDN